MLAGEKKDGSVASQSRGVFVSGLGAFAATVGSAVGLGNIWKFPTETGNNGGAAFVVAYLGFVVLMGIPIMVAEHAIGRKTRKNAVHAYGTVAPGKKGWSVLGWVGLCCGFFGDGLLYRCGRVGVCLHWEVVLGCGPGGGLSRTMTSSPCRKERGFHCCARRG